LELREREREEIIGGWRKLHKLEVHNLYFPSNNIRVIKLKIKLVEHVTYMQR